MKASTVATSRCRRIYIAAWAALSALICIFLLPDAAPATLGDCIQPFSTGAENVASDCLYILNVAVGLTTCNPPCICAPKGTLPTFATDALICLRDAVGQTVVLNCPCTAETTTTTLCSDDNCPAGQSCQDNSCTCVVAQGTPPAECGHDDDCDATHHCDHDLCLCVANPTECPNAGDPIGSGSVSAHDAPCRNPGEAAPQEDCKDIAECLECADNSYCDENAHKCFQCDESFHCSSTEQACEKSTDCCPDNVVNICKCRDLDQGFPCTCDR